MASTSSLFSQTLQEITNTKLDELEKKQTVFKQGQRRITATTQAQGDDVERLFKLSNDVKKLFSISTGDGRRPLGPMKNIHLETDLRNLDRFLVQARFDPNISPRILTNWQQALLRHVDTQALKYSYATLYGKLTTEWLASKKPALPASPDVRAEGSEQTPSSSKLESRLKWESAVFEPANVDTEALASMLRALFQVDTNSARPMHNALADLRNKVRTFEAELARPYLFNVRDLEWVVAGLISSDLLTDEKRGILKDFSDNKIILSEIADVLNMRVAALSDWTWGQEVQVEQRRQLNGGYNIFMQEDLLQAIFLQYIGVRWSVFWRANLKSFRRSEGVWKSPQKSIPLDDKKRRDFFLCAQGRPSVGPSVESEKQKIYQKDYFLSQLLRSEDQTAGTIEGEQEAQIKKPAMAAQAMAMQQPQVLSLFGQAPFGSRAPPPPPPPHHASVNGPASRSLPPNMGFTNHGYGHQEADDDDKGQAINPMDAKQRLLHLLSTEIAVKCRLRGGITCFRSSVDNLFPSLPHATIAAVFKFFGVSEVWSGFFRKFLEAPLRFKDEQAAPRVRKRGTPGSHVLSEVFGEVVLFCLDFKVNQDTNGEVLWRLHDDLWFWSADHDVCEEAWKSVTCFAQATGLQVDEAKSGSARMRKSPQADTQFDNVDVGNKLPKAYIKWGMLYLNPTSGRFEIDQNMVNEHIVELSRQLKDKSGSIFSWIQTWNVYATKFFTSNFGQPANCYGRYHVDSMLVAHERIQRQIFAISMGAEADHKSGSVVEYLKQAIEQRFGISGIPDGYFFFPTELGGLDVQSPFIGLLQIRDSVVDSPRTLLDTFEDAEQQAYAAAKRAFERLGPFASRARNLDPNFIPPDANSFFSFQEYTKYREELHYGYENELVQTYHKLLEKPKEEEIENHNADGIKAALSELRRRAASPANLKGVLSDWHSMTPYWKWVVQLYGPEVLDKFGGFTIVEQGLLPMGMVSLFRSGRVAWQE